MTSGGETTELGFFKLFIQELYKDDPISQTSVDIPIEATDSDVQEELFREMRRVLDNKIVHDDTDEPGKLSIKYCDMGSFIITIRNKFFHNLNGRGGNIQSKNIPDTDLFFETMNDLALQWLATVFLGVFSHTISEYQKIKQTAV